MLDEVIELAITVGDGFCRGVAETMRSNIITSALVEPVSALRLMLDSVENAAPGEYAGSGHELVRGGRGTPGAQRAGRHCRPRLGSSPTAGGRSWSFSNEKYQMALDSLIGRMGTDRYAERLAQGAALRDEEAVELARSALSEVERSARADADGGETSD